MPVMLQQALGWGLTVVGLLVGALGLLLLVGLLHAVQIGYPNLRPVRGAIDVTVLLAIAVAAAWGGQRLRRR
jgi:hypothetical protein